MPSVAVLKQFDVYKVSAITLLSAFLYFLHITNANAFFMDNPTNEVKQALRYAIQENETRSKQTKYTREPVADTQAEPVNEHAPSVTNTPLKPQAKPIESIVENQTPKPAQTANTGETARLLLGQAFLQAAAGAH